MLATHTSIYRELLWSVWLRGKAENCCCFNNQPSDPILTPSHLLWMIVEHLNGRELIVASVQVCWASYHSSGLKGREWTKLPHTHTQPSTVNYWGAFESVERRRKHCCFNNQPVQASDLSGFRPTWRLSSAIVGCLPTLLEAPSFMPCRISNISTCRGSKLWFNASIKSCCPRFSSSDCESCRAWCPCWIPHSWAFWN